MTSFFGENSKFMSIDFDDYSALDCGKVEIIWDCKIYKIRVYSIKISLQCIYFWHVISCILAAEPKHTI